MSGSAGLSGWRSEMRVPVSWLREYAPIPEPYDALEVGRRLTQAGLEVEAVEQAGHDVHGVITAQVITVEELTGYKKPIRYCRVATSDAELTAVPETLTGVICGAVNFAAGDRVAFAVVGATLPGGFEITAAKKYGRISEGMICAVDELGIGEDHSGILILPPDTPLGVDFVEYAGLRDDVLDITVTPDRGYAVSVRGVARELATAYQVPYTDPATTFVPGEDASGRPGDPPPGGAGAGPGQAPWPAAIDDPTACDRFVLREVRGFDPGAPTPLWMQVRLARCGLRSISLAVDVTNYLMIELGQPLHAFDRSKLQGPIVVRRARPGETLVTLDHVTRTLCPDDILITDDSGPISLAGTMGGLATEIDDDSTDIVIEGAHFSDTGTAKMSRRHRLHSEASYRFERGVDRELPPRAPERAAALLASLGGATIVPGLTRAEVPVAPVTIELAADYPDRVAGVVYGLDTVVARLQEVGCEVRSTPASHEPTIAPWRAQPPDGADHHAKHDRQHTVLLVTPPSWRPDLTDPADLAEEVIRLEGYSNIPVRQPRATAGKGLTVRQRALRAVSRALADDGFVEVRSEPFGPASDADRLMLPPDDPRRTAAAGAHPAQGERAAAAHAAAARPLPRPRAERRARLRRHRAVRDRPGLPAPAGRAGGRADSRHRPGADRGGAGDGRRGAAGAAAAGRRGAGRVPRAARPVGSRTARDLGRRDRGGPRAGGRGARDAGRAGGGRAPVPPGAVRGALRAGGRDRRRPGIARVAGRLRGRAAPEGGRRVRPARADLRLRARPGRDRGRRRGGGPGGRPAPVGLPARHPEHRAGGGGRRARRRRGGGAHRRRGRAA